MRSFAPEGSRLQDPHVVQMLQTPAALREAMASEEVLEATAVLCDSRHDLHVRLGCMEGIIPHDEGAIGIADGTVKDIALLSRVGKAVCFTVQAFETLPDGTKRAVLSRRRAQQLCRERFLSTLRTGDIIPAKVTRLENFGAFCDIGCGLVALLPIACMSVSRITHPRDRVAVGDELFCVVTSLEEGRICLSMRELLGTWEENAARFAVGETVIGVVRSVESYGVFVELAPNLAGLAEPFEGAAVGQTACVFIKNILPDKMKIKLVIIDTHDETPNPVPLCFFAREGHVSHWSYAPPNSGRLIESVFDHRT